MKLIKKTKKPVYYDNILIDYITVYTVNELPKERDFINLESKKGYVVSIQLDEEANAYAVYLEKHLDDWNNQIEDYCDVVYLSKKEV